VRNTAFQALAALLIALVVGALTLAVCQYVEHGRASRLSTFEALARALHLATAAGTGSAPEVEAAFAREVPFVREGERATRAFFVRKGTRLEALNISKPARVETSIRLGEAAAGDDERLVTLCARLEERSGPRSGVELDTKSLAWLEPGAGAGESPRVIGTWPVLDRGIFQGVAGVEMIPFEAPPAPWAGPLAVGTLTLAVFLVLLLLFKRERTAFLAAAVVALAASGWLLLAAQSEQVKRMAEVRDQTATRLVNRLVWTSPEAVRTLDSIWTRVFGERPESLQVGQVKDALVCQETPSSLAALAGSATIAPLIVMALLLAIGLLLLPGLASLLGGISTMPGVYAYVAPAMLGMLVLVLCPFIMGVGLGFFNSEYEFVGLANFSDILFPSQESPTNFYFTLGVTVLWTVSNVVLHVVIGLALALLLNSPKIRFRALFRVLLIIPWAVPNYVTALIWKWMFTSQIGAINLFLEALGLEPVAWFGPSFWTNFFAVLATNTWLGFPFMMVVSLGALQSIPAELYEAADIDGASRWQKFRNITLPLLKPALFPAIILGVIWTFNMFNVIFLVTRGQPDNKTNILITEAYRFFAELNQYGVAAAYCVLIFMILLLYTLITNRITRATQGAFE
jgi:ABC-type sugar transport system permease subunit